MRLDRALDRRMVVARRHLSDLRRRLRDPAARMSAARARRTELVQRLERATDRRLTGDRERLTHLRARLEAVAPTRVLERGYAIVEGPGGVVRHPDVLTPEDRLTVTVAGGRFTARVSAERPDAS